METSRLAQSGLPALGEPMRIVLPFSVLFTALLLAAPAQANVDARVDTPIDRAVWISNPVGIVIEINAGPGNGESEPNDDDLCIPDEGNGCLFCVGLAGPIDIYDDPRTAEGLGVGVGTNDVGLTVKVGAGEVNCPHEV